MRIDPKPRVLIIHPVLWSHYKAKVLTELYSLCVKDGVAFKALQLASNWEGGRKLGGADAKIHRYPYKLLFDRNLESIPFRDRLLSQIKEVLAYKPSLLVLPGYSDFSHWILLLVSKVFLKLKVIVAIDSTVKDRPRVYWKEMLKQVFVRSCDAAFCYGTASSAYAETLGMHKGRIYIRFQATDNDTIKAVFETAKRTRQNLIPRYKVKNRNFIFVGRLSPEKNLSVLLLSFKSAVESCKALSDWGLILVGDGPQRGELESLVHKNDIPNVFFLGGKAWDQVPIFYALSDVFVLPSITEPWGLVVNEAMLCGLPVAVSNTVGASYNLVRDGENGFRFSPHNQEELSSVLQKFMSDKVDIQGMGKKSEEIIKDYTPEIAAAQMYRGINSVLRLNRKYIV